MRLKPLLSMNRACYLITFGTLLSLLNCQRHFDVIIVSLTTISNALFMFLNPVLYRYKTLLVFLFDFLGCSNIARDFFIRKYAMCVKLSKSELQKPDYQNFVSLAKC